MSKSIKIVVVGVVIAVLVAVLAILGTSLYTNSPSYQLHLAERYISEMNYEQAIIALEKYLEIEPNDSEAWLKLSEAYYNLGDIEQAINVLSKAIEINDDQALAHRRESLNLERSGQSDVENGQTNETTASVTQITSTSQVPVIATETVESLETTVETNETTIETTVEVPVVEVLSYRATGFEGSFDYPNGISDEYIVERETVNGWETVKSSPYPLEVSSDGYIVYYDNKTANSAVICMENPEGEIISQTTINGGEGYIDSMYIGFGMYVSRFWCSFVYNDYAFYETTDCLYILGKDGSVVKSDSFRTDGDVYWAAYQEGVGILSYAYGSGYSRGNPNNYFYLPDTGKLYLDVFPETLERNGKKYNKAICRNKNYGTNIVIAYYEDDPNNFDLYTIDGINPMYYCYAVGNIADGTVSKFYQSIEETDNILTAVDFSGNTEYIDLS